MVGHRTFDQNMFASDIKDLFIHVTYSVYVSYKNITPGC